MFFTGWTVAPDITSPAGCRIIRFTLAPRKGSFSAVAILEDLGKSIPQAVELGWIRAPSVAARITRSLEAARKQLDRENKEGSRDLLNLILHTARSEKEAMTKEGYLLVAMNAEYVLSRLR